MSQVASRLPQVVSESRNGQAAWLSVASQRAVSALTATVATHAMRFVRRGHVVTERVASP